MALFSIFKKENVGEENQKESWFSKLKRKLSKSSNLFNKIFSLFQSSEVDYLKFEELLIDADIDYYTTKEIIENIKFVSIKEKVDPAKAKQLVKSHILDILNKSYKKFDLTQHNDDPLKIIFFCGINGSGKTTSIAKIASLFKLQFKTLLVGCDSFRIAANQQLGEWAKRLDLEVFDSDSAKTDKQPTIAYKSVDFATSTNSELLLIDTSGRMANNINLMEELKKTASVFQKHNPKYPQEIILVVDGTQGQNTQEQVDKFSKSVNITGLIITKLDGISKGGIIISISRKFKLPIYFIGIGEKEEDIDYFNPEEFVDGLLG